MGIEEYKAYTRQLENDVGKWHHAFDALMVERNQLVNRIRELENFIQEKYQDISSQED